jgi:small GTP-binding protein
MIQKKICMVGMYATGKTSLVQRYVHSIFSAKYHSTVGVKIDRKEVNLAATVVSLLLWDIEGQTDEQEIPASYLRGAHGMFFVADGTRRETVDALFDLRELARSAAGDVPSIVALNKTDLQDQWTVAASDTSKLIGAGFHVLRTSAKSGDGVEDSFRWLANATIGGPPSPTEHPQVRHAR